MVTMLSTDDLARLREMADGRKHSYSHCAIVPGTLIELIRVYAAVLGAQTGTAHIDIFGGTCIMADGPDLKAGTVVRLVPLGAGKGDGDG